MNVRNAVTAVLLTAVPAMAFGHGYGHDYGAPEQIETPSDEECVELMKLKETQLARPSIRQMIRLCEAKQQSAPADVSKAKAKAGSN